MNSIETLATFFGWCAVINIGIILFGALKLSLFHEWVAKLNAKIFGITKEEAKRGVFHVFQQYRLAFVVLNAVPYIVLKIMA